jgi:Acyclic terpene utilisation family protein AtuA
VVARFDTVRVTDAGPDRVRLSGTRGDPAPDRLKVAVNYLGGFRNSMSFVLTGLDVDAKAAMAEAALFERLGGRDRFQTAETRLIGRPATDPSSAEESIAELRVTVKDPDPAKVGRAFSNAAIELALATYPGCYTTTPPADATPYGIYWPALVRAELVEQVVVLPDGRRLPVKPPPNSPGPAPDPSGPPGPPDALQPHPSVPGPPVGERSPTPGSEDPAVHSPRPTIQAPLGRAFGARSGDKGGTANVGVWARNQRAYRFLEGFLTVERFRDLIPEARDLDVRRYELPNLLAVNFVVGGLLGEGVSSSTRIDPQAKGLGEWLRARVVDLPAELLEPQGG